jgi:plastocyanin domain-containing protein
MDPGALVVTLAGVALIAAVNLYFFTGRRVRAAVANAGGAVEVRIRVRGGYDPAVVQVPAGRRARLVFLREETEGCSDTVLLPEWGIARSLPAHVPTAVEFTPLKPGSYDFTCGMHMLRGTIVVTAGPDADTVGPPVKMS